MKKEQFKSYFRFANRIFKKLHRFLKEEKYPDSYDKIPFKFDTIIHYLTWRCNSRCITCNCWKTPLSERNKELWNVKNVEKFYSNLDVDTVFLTGGEPTIRPDFKEIAFAIYKSCGARISFTTNGLITEKIKKDLVWLKEKGIPFLLVQPSCNGFEKIHDFSRGIAGNYKKILKLIRFLKDNKFQFILSYTIFPFNIDETVKFVKFWKNKGVNVFINIGRMDKKRYRLEKEYERYVFSKREDYLKVEHSLFELSSIYPEYLLQYYFVKSINKGEKFFPCFGLARRIVIDPYGNVYPCDLLLERLCLGNIENSDFNFSLFVKSNQTKIKGIFETIKDKKCQPCFNPCDLLFDSIYSTFTKKDLIKILINRIYQNIRLSQ